MTVTDRTGEDDATFAAMKARVEAADEAPESFEQQLSTAIHVALERHGGGCRCGQAGYLDCQYAADAALDVVRGEGRQA